MVTGVSSSSQQYKLALNILGEHFGPFVRDVGGYLLRRGQATLTDVRRFLEEESEHRGTKLSAVKEALVVLIQQNLARAVMPTAQELQRVHPRTFLYYEVDLDAVTLRLRFPKFLLRARELFGREGQVVLEEVLLHGRLDMGQIEANATSKVLALRRRTAARRAAEAGEGGRAAAPEQKHEEEQEEEEPDEGTVRSKVRAAAEAMARGRYLVRVQPFDLSKPTVLAVPTTPGSRSSTSKAVAAAAAAQQRQQQQQTASAAAVTGVRKRRARFGEEEEEDGEAEQEPLEIALMLDSSKAGAFSSFSSSSSSSSSAAAAAAAAVAAAARGAGHDELNMNGKQPAAAAAAPGRPGRKRKAPVGGAEEAGAGAASKKRSPPAPLPPPSLTAPIAPLDTPNGLFEEEEEEEDLPETAGEAAAAAVTLGKGQEQGVLWRAGVDQFHRDLRHQACVRFVRQKVNSTAEALVRAILAHSLPLEREVATERSCELDARELGRQVQLPPNVTVRMYMDVLKNDQVRIVGGGPLPSLTAEAGAGQAQQGEQEEKYCVHLGNIVDSLRHRTLHSIIRDRYAREDKLPGQGGGGSGGGGGERNARICRVLMDKRFVDQQQLSELAMMSLRETRERLYHMYRDGVVTFQEVPRRADHHPNQTFYLWAFDARRVMAELLDRMHKGALNLRLRRQREVGEKGDLLANKDNIRDEVEAAHFDRLTAALDRLDQALENLDETVMLFTVF